MPSSIENLNLWLNTKQAARYVNQSEGTLRSWRSTGRHDLKPFKRGKNGRVYYWKPFLDRWLEQWARDQQSPD